MSDAQPQADIDDREQQVLDYLAEHPDFLASHPELLEALKVPHNTGGTSLLEHQVSVLREKNQRYARRLRDYHSVAEDNAQLLERIHDLYRVMLNARSAPELIGRLMAELRDGFGCHAVAIALYADSPPDGTVGLTGPAAEKAFAGLRSSPIPAVGRLSRDKLDLLFPDQAEALSSVALAPLDESGEQGLLVLASRDENTYHPGMGTLFIQLLGRMLGESLRRLTADP